MNNGSNKLISDSAGLYGINLIDEVIQQTNNGLIELGEDKVHAELIASLDYIRQTVLNLQGLIESKKPSREEYEILISKLLESQQMLDQYRMDRVVSSEVKRYLSKVSYEMTSLYTFYKSAIMDSESE